MMTDRCRRSGPLTGSAAVAVRQVLALAVILLAFVGATPAAGDDGFATSAVVIDTAAGGHYRFTVEMAVTVDQQRRGLMYRRKLAPDAGMLFVFPQQQTTSFWMKNTFLTLDMIFIGEDGVVAGVHAGAVPLSEAAIPSPGPVKAVLEIGGGIAARLGVRRGDIVRHETFGNAR